jgi:two-component system chemotaxis sensor kinase CheA
VKGQQIVIVEVTDRRAAIAVDRLEGQQDIVVKAFDAVKGATPCTGAAILPDGSAALILDVGGLLQEH